MARYLRNEKGFLTLISMLIALGLICFFVYYVINAYFNPVPSTKAGATSVGPSPSMANTRSIVGNTKDIVQEMNKKTADQDSEINKALGK